MEVEKYLLIAVLGAFLTIGSTSTAQTFSNLYGEEVDDNGYVSLELMSGDFVVFGNTRVSSDSAPITARCISITGEELWYESYSEEDIYLYYPSCAFVTEDGNILVSGERKNTVTDTTEFVFMKMTPDGQLQWFNSYGGYWRLLFGSAFESPDGTILVSGSAYPFSTFAIADVFVAKFDSNAEILWDVRFETVEKDGAASILALENEELLVTGYRHVAPEPDQEIDMLLIRLDGDGSLIWEETYNVGLSEFGGQSAQLIDGGFLTVGHAHKYPIILKDILAVRTDAEGQLNWIERYGGDSEESCKAFYLDENEDALMVGFSTDIALDEEDALLMKINVAGDSLWSENYGYDFADDFRHILKTSTGQLLMTGISEGEFDIDNEQFVVLTDMNGLLSIEAFSSQSSFHIYPNPNNGDFKIVLPKESIGLSSIRIHNSIGQEVCYSEVSYLSREYNVTLPILSRGVYQLTVEYGGIWQGVSQIVIDR